MEYTSQVKKPFKKSRRQVRGVLRMMDEEKECKDVISQLSAARSALDRAIALIVAENLQVCVKEQYENGEENSDVVQEAIQLLVKSR